MKDVALSFTAPVVKGSGRGRTIGAATINLDMSAVPDDLAEGIYACRVSHNKEVMDAVMHYGPRPVFRDAKSCEIHVLDAVIAKAPKQMTVIVIEKLRDIQDFPSVTDMMKQIAHDIEDARGILDAHDQSSQKADF